MTTDNPTYGDLVTVAMNLNAEGQTSRAQLISNTADYVKKLEWEVHRLRTTIKTFSGDCGWDVPNLDDFGQYEIDGRTLKALLAAIRE
jgi:hypothetical protein